MTARVLLSSPSLSSFCPSSSPHLVLVLSFFFCFTSDSSSTRLDVESSIRCRKRGPSVSARLSLFASINLPLFSTALVFLWAPARQRDRETSVCLVKYRSSEKKKRSHCVFWGRLAAYKARRLLISSQGKGKLSTCQPGDFLAEPVALDVLFFLSRWTVHPCWGVCTLHWTCAHACMHAAGIPFDSTAGVMVVELEGAGRAFTRMDKRTDIDSQGRGFVEAFQSTVFLDRHKRSHVPAASTRT